MSRTRIVKGTYTKITGGDHNMYAKGNIVTTAGKSINEFGKEGGVTYGEPKKPPLFPKHFFVKGWWSSDEAGTKEITEALVDDIVYFHVETKNIPDGEVVQMKLYDDDNTEIEESTEKNENDKDDFIVTTSGNKAGITDKKVNGNKIVIALRLANLEKFIANEADKEVELYYRSSYKGEHVELPRTPSDYLKVKEKEPLIIFVCGYWNKNIPYAGEESDEKYWGKKLRDSTKKYFNTQKEIFINGAGTWHSMGSTRFESGQKFAEDRFSNTSSKFFQEVYKQKRKIMIISHSMGAAFAEGMIKVLLSKKINVDKVIHFSPADPSGFSANSPNKTYQIDIDWDPVLMYKNFDDAPVIKGIKASAIIKNPKKDEFGHMYTKEEDFVWNWFEDLELIEFQFLNEETKTFSTPSNGMGYGGTTYKVIQKNNKANNLKHNTNFLRVMKNGAFYFYDSKTKQYYTAK